MSPRPGPSRAFAVRDAHRHWLTGHLVLLLVLVGGALALNRQLSPERLWAHWVAAAAGAAFALHLVVFARATLRTMGGGSRG